MKILYKFKKNKDEGDKKVEYTVILREPNRDEKQALSVFYSKTLFDLLKQGMPSVNMLDKLHADNVGGVLSEKEHQEFKSLQEKLFELQKEFERKPEQATELTEKINVVRGRMNELQMQKDSIYNNTAEIFARNKTVEKILLDFSMIQKLDTPAIPIFGDGDYNSKMDKLESISNSEFYASVIASLFATSTLYWVHGITDTTRIAEVMDDIVKGDYGDFPEETVPEAEEEATTEEVSVEEVKKPKRHSK